MSTYIMGVFKITKDLINEINRYMQKFWWGWTRQSLDILVKLAAYRKGEKM